MHDFYFTIPFGFILVVGGVIGYGKRGSTASLAGGLGIGILLLVSGFVSLKTLDTQRNSHLPMIVETGNCRGSYVPALYVFGDSLLDAGNNNFLQNDVKANYFPYGIDFPRGTTGRFTNGATFVDYIARWLGLPFAPPYLALSELEKSIITTGINYASGAAGILQESGTALGDNLALDEQINYFKRTVKNDLPKFFKNPKLLSWYLSKSIFVVNIGSNDYINNYLQPAVYNSSKTYTPQQFADLMLSTLKQSLTTIYNLGARKFVVFEIGTIGCIPAIVNSIIPKPTTPCAEDVNNLIKLYNNGFPGMIQELRSSLQGSTFVRVDIFERGHEVNQDPVKFGYTAEKTPCCVVGGNGTTTCIPDQQPCKDRDTRLYWDAFHPMQRQNYQTAYNCFRGSSICSPTNIQQLTCMKARTMQGRGYSSLLGRLSSDATTKLPNWLQRFFTVQPY